ncbi:MAG TPA: hypothetical protein VFB96_17825 [Pirellulaceae bacterium]|jgi:hypothetical protein|nr:hypothetical protein [Pirellulaceae bacterium]
MHKVVRYVRGLPFRFGGEEHSGWLPPGAATPLPTPVHDVLLNVEILSDGSGTGFLLDYYTDDGKFAFDDWFASLEEAEKAAMERFGIKADQWQTNS